MQKRNSVLKLLALFGVLIVLLLVFAFWLLNSINKAIVSYEDQFYNESAETVEIKVLYTDSENGDALWAERAFTLNAGEYGKYTVEHGRFTPTCIFVSKSESGFWVNAHSVVEVINAEWHEMPSVRRYVITGEEDPSQYCQNNFGQH